MRTIIPSLLLAASSVLCSHAQQAQEAITYFLPKTAIHLKLVVEKTTYTPGQLAEYAQRYMRLDNVKLSENVEYRIIGAEIYSSAEPDTAKQYTLRIDKQHYISNVDLSEKGLLLAINGKGDTKDYTPSFYSSKPQASLNPKQYMSQEILSATSSAKMAELTANEIFEIRDSRVQLSRGEADFMPKDGAQLKIMMAQLDTQEKALTQVFGGVTTIDTTSTSLTYIPNKEVDKLVLFRFSKHFGLVDDDDLSGEPYYIRVADKQSFREKPAAKEQKKDKNDIGLRVNIPSKMDIVVYNGEGKTLAKQQLQAPQFGITETLSGELFSKKQSSKLIIDGRTGAIAKIEALPIEK